MTSLTEIVFVEIDIMVAKSISYDCTGFSTSPYVTISVSDITIATNEV